MTPVEWLECDYNARDSKGWRRSSGAWACVRPMIELCKDTVNNEWWILDAAKWPVPNEDDAI